MPPDHDLLLTTTAATLFFAAIAFFFPTILRRIKGTRRLKLPHPILILVFRLWFAALALGALYLTVFGRAGLSPR